MGMAEDLKAVEGLYNALVAQGVPSDRAYAIARQGSYPESATQNPGETWMGYRGWQDEERAGESQPQARDQRMMDLMGNAAAAQARRERPISYQPGGGQMPGMPWDDPSVGAGMMGGGLTPDMLRRIQLYQAIMGMGRGAGGMQPNPNTNNLITQLQGGGQQGSMGMSPQMMAMLQYYMQNQVNNLGPQPGGSMQGPAYPQGGGVDLSTLLGTLGFPTR